jgi:toxic protein SymE
MADLHHNSEPFIFQALRHSTVGYVPDPYRHPQVKLKGKWLAQAGFFVGTPLTVRVMEGCLVITAGTSPLMNEVLQLTDRLSVQSRLELEQIIQSLVLKEKLTKKQLAK